MNIDTLPEKELPSTRRVLWAPIDQPDLTSLLNETHGPLVEVGGITPEGYPGVNLSCLSKRIYICDIEHTPIALNKKLYRRGQFYYQGDDFLADATNLPFADNTVGGLLAAHLPVNTIIRGKLIIPDTRLYLALETERVLEPGGLFVYRGASLTDRQFILGATKLRLVRQTNTTVVPKKGPVYPSFALVLRKSL